MTWATDSRRFASRPVTVWPLDSPAWKPTTAYQNRLQPVTATHPTAVPTGIATPSAASPSAGQPRPGRALPAAAAVVRPDLPPRGHGTVRASSTSGPSTADCFISRAEPHTAPARTSQPRPSRPRHQARASARPQAASAAASSSPFSS